MATRFQLRRRATGQAAGAPAALLSGELSYNMSDGKLYIGYGDDGGGNATSIKVVSKDDFFVNIPSTGTPGQILERTGGGVQWTTPSVGSIYSADGNGIELTGSVFSLNYTEVATGIGLGNYITTTQANINYQPKDADLTAIAALGATAGFLKKTGADTWTVDTSTYLTTAAATAGYQPLDGDLTSIAGLAGTAGILTKTGANTFILDTTAYLSTASAASTYLTQANAASTYLTQANATANYQPLDGDLTSIAGLAGTTGILRKTGANTWTLDTVDMATQAELDAAIATRAPTSHTHSAADITSGVFDIARIPVLPGSQVLVSSGAISALSAPQQAEIDEGSIVTTTDGRRWVYSGAGSKTVEASYVELADITPEWSVIANKPAFATVATSGAYADLSGRPTLATVATTGAYSDLTGKPTLGTMAAQNANAVAITGGTIDGVTLDGGTF